MAVSKNSGSNLVEELGAHDYHLRVLNLFRGRHATTAWTILCVIVVGGLVFGGRSWLAARSAVAAHEQVGRAHLFLEEGGVDSAREILHVVTMEHGGIEAAKASLLLGNLEYAAGRWAEAESAWMRAAEEGRGIPLLEGGGLRAAASARLQQGDLEGAVNLFREVLNRFQRREPGQVLDAGVEPDLLPLLQRTQWQLVLTLDSLGRSGDALATAQDLVRRYPREEEAVEARRLLAERGEGGSY